MTMPQQGKTTPPDESTSYNHPFCPSRVARHSMRTRHHMGVPPPWKQSSDLTSSRYTTFRIVNKMASYMVCEEVEVEIIARDGLNQLRRSGGDYFRVKAMTVNETFSAGTATDDEVIDHGNGTYTAYVTLKVRSRFLVLSRNVL